MGAGSSNSDWMTVAEATAFLGEDEVREITDLFKEITPSDWNTVGPTLFQKRICEDCIPFLPTAISDGMYNMTATDKDGDMKLDSLLQLTAVLRSTDEETAAKFAFRVLEHSRNVQQRSKPITHRELTWVASLLESTPPECGGTLETIDQPVTVDEFCIWAKDKPRSPMISWVPILKSRFCKKRESPSTIIQQTPSPKISRSKLIDVFKFENSAVQNDDTKFITEEEFTDKLSTLVFDGTDEVEISSCIQVFKTLEIPLHALRLSTLSMYIETNKPIPDVSPPSPNAPNNAGLLTEVEHSYMVTQLTLLHGRHCRLSGNGVLSKKYLKKLLDGTSCSASDVDSIFNDIDVSNSGTLSLEECLRSITDIDSSTWCNIKNIITKPDVMLRLQIQPRLRQDEVNLILKSDPVYSGGLSRDIGINWYILPDYWLEKWIPPEGVRQSMLSVPPGIPKIAPTIKFPEGRYHMINEDSYIALKYWYGGGDAIATAKRIVLPSGELEQALVPVHISYGTASVRIHRSTMTPITSIKSQACSLFKVIERSCSISCDDQLLLKDLTPSAVGTYDLSIRITPWKKPVENSQESVFFPVDMKCRFVMLITRKKSDEEDETYEKDVYLNQTISGIIEGDPHLFSLSTEMKTRIQTAVCKGTTALDIIQGFEDDKTFYGDAKVSISLESFLVSAPTQRPLLDQLLEMYVPQKQQQQQQGVSYSFTIQKVMIKSFSESDNMIVVKIPKNENSDEKNELLALPSKWQVPKPEMMFNDGPKESLKKKSKKKKKKNDEEEEESVEMSEVSSPTESQQELTDIEDFKAPYELSPLRVGDTIECYVHRQGQRSALTQTLVIGSIVRSRGLVIALEIDEDIASPKSVQKKSNQQPTTQLQRSSTLIPVAWIVTRVHAAHSSSLIGLNNLGNTCFLNSGIQCLGHTRLLREYFLKRQYLYDMTPAAAKDPISLAVSFDNIISDLWINSKHISNKALRGTSPSKPYVDMSSFHEIFTKKYSAFTAGEQHDAHEALETLLNGLGEELNRSTDSKLVEQTPQTDPWKQYLQKHNSAMTYILTGELGSSVVCKRCGPEEDSQESSEPFTHLSLPIPYTKNVNCDVIIREIGGNYQKMRLTVPRDKQLISDLAVVVAEKFPNCSVLVAQVQFSVVRRILYKSGIASTQSQVPAHRFNLADPAGFEVPIYYMSEKLSDSEKIVTLHISHRFSGENRLLGKPFIIQIPFFTDKQLTLKGLYDILKKEVQTMVPDYSLALKPTPFYIVDVKSNNPLRCLHCSWLGSCTGCKVVLDYDLPGANKTERHISIVWDDGVLHKEHRPVWSADVEFELEKVQAPVLDGSTLDSCLEKFSTPEDISINCSKCRSRDLELGGDYIEQQFYLTTNDYSITLKASVPEGTSRGLLKSLCKQRPLKVEDLMVVDYSEKDDNGFIVPGDAMLKDLTSPTVVPMLAENETLIAITIADTVVVKGDSKKLNPFIIKSLTETTPKAIKGEIWKTVRRCIQINDLESIQITNELILMDENGIVLDNLTAITLKDKSEFVLSFNGTFQPTVVSDVERDDAALKKLEIKLSPLILVIQLKRFTFDGYSTTKLNTFIKFPLSGLKIGEHTYTLYAVLNHIGSATAGHYYSQVRLDHTGTWWTYNDVLTHQTIHPTRFNTQTAEEAVVTSSAYILFYQRDDASDKHIGDVFPRVTEACHAPPVPTVDKPTDRGGCQFM